MVCPLGTVMGSSPTSRVFLLTTRAEVSMKKVRSRSAKDLASSTETARRWRRSDLFPTSMTTMLDSVWSLSSLSHLSTFSKVTGETDLSCPAVSQICALMIFPSTLTLRVANSTPMVDFVSRLNSFLVNRDNRFDFPTPESPISTTLNR
ncbi:unnamed protein product [Spirodela intermedia]|uniref:Uncharacterized protein n=2 Tax=Spirodela intermedia TaxID=51605 RepID=A0A7I8JN07_SPIIN|nr:unnamed protein product [Spirodela intermedia]CAA6671544.1 unnamed protein product [Spirodela intermedia]CAA7408646.1 unnamed protein product [Spirodela intermedia]